MWKFADPIKHAIPETRWPTMAEASSSLLYQPINIGALTLTSRTWVPAMVPWRATEDGFVTQDNLDWYRRFAAGRPAALVVEATGIRDIPSGPLLRIGHDRFIPGLKRLVETVREASDGQTKLFIQIIDFLAVKRRPDPQKYFQRFLEITTQHRERLSEVTGYSNWIDADEANAREFLQCAEDDVLEHVLNERELEALRFGYRERVTDTHLPHIKDLPQVLPKIFADASARARAAGFDGVELHYAHAYTMAGFLSALNDRDDGYGGSRENRARLPLEVYRAVRERAGADYLVGVRFLGDEVIAGGNRIDDATYFAIEFARAGFDYLSISKGGKFEDAEQPKVGQAVYPYTGQSGYECMPTTLSDERGPFGRSVTLVKQIKRAVNTAGFSTPIVATGGITTFEQAEAILRNGDADIIGMARQALADPDWFRKVKAGRGEDVRRCTYTNYCEALDQAHRQVTCKLWDRKELDEPGITLAADGRRRLLPPEWIYPQITLKKS
ncbi:MAG TPA: NADH:flavin oxidoreductase [Pyrinomonadaceae bacterium]|jgi:2,4-dienoyl-CoA reductase-like NADH-dependent reductase (Old Yellow Enzyme family)|nr:NADH:flavin oxidoreductase [Pyrinomonadaceae bacterium]